jgi:hypothetical protein
MSLDALDAREAAEDLARVRAQAAAQTAEWLRRTTLGLPTALVRSRATAGAIAGTITCLVCGRTSFHRDDVRHRSCAWCHRFHRRITRR